MQRHTNIFRFSNFRFQRGRGRQRRGARFQRRPARRRRDAPEGIFFKK